LIFLWLLSLHQDKESNNQLFAKEYELKVTRQKATLKAACIKANIRSIKCKKKLVL
jgi:hypothetical protein